MEIRQLKYFAAVADTLNFSRAAETLFISQSALSKQIADLERELGMVLLQRDKRSVRLTPAGKVFLNEAKVILMRMDTIPILLKNTEDIEKKGKRNVFIGVENRVGDSPIFHLGVAEAVHQLRQEMPTLRAIFKMGEYLDINRDISEETLNMGVFMGTKEDVNESLKYRVLYEDEMVVVYRGEPVETAGIEGIKQILSEKPLYIIDKEFRGMSQVVRMLGAIGCAPSIHFCESTLDMSFIMESGEGCVVMPASMVRKYKNPKIHTLATHRPEAKLYFMAMWKKEGEHRLGGDDCTQSRGLILKHLNNGQYSKEEAMIGKNRFMSGIFMRTISQELSH